MFCSLGFCRAPQFTAVFERFVEYYKRLNCLVASTLPRISRALWLEFVVYFRNWAVLWTFFNVC